MSEYKGIKGFQVQTRTEDPTPYAQALANNPYSGSWSSGGDLNSARSLLGGFGAPTGASANIVFGGSNPGGPSPSPNYAIAESYNGSSWTEVADLNTGRQLPSGFGTTTAGYSIAGNYDGAPGAGSNNVESWNGSAWSETTEINSARIAGVATGTTTAGLFSTGTSPTGGGSQTLNESWNGSAWTEVADLNQARREGAGSGTTNTAALVFGGRNPPSSATLATNELWNGSAWTETGDLNTTRYALSGSGSSTAAIAFAGTAPPGKIANTEQWDGSSWTEVNDLATARASGANGTVGTSSTSLLSGGDTGSIVATTEEWTFGGLDPSTTPAADYSDAIIGDFYYNSSEGKFKGSVDGLTAGSWAAGGDLNTGGYRIAGGAGVQTAGLMVGRASPNKANVESYDGSSWTEVADVSSAAADAATTGLQTAAMTVGRSPYSNDVENFDGSSWTEGPNLPYSIERSSLLGVQTSAFLVTGRNPNAVTTTAEWDGSSWTSGAAYPATGYNQASGGSQTAAIVFGGYSPGPDGSTLVNTYNGSSFTAATSLNSARAETGWGGRTSQDSVYIAGGTSPQSGKTELWNGTSWTEVSDLATSRSAMGSSGTVNSGWVAGGSPPGSAYQGTEEWSASDFLNKTVTSS